MACAAADKSIAAQLGANRGRAAPATARTGALVPAADSAIDRAGAIGR